MDVKSLINKALSVGAMKVYIDAEQIENITAVNLPPLQFSEVESEKSTSSSNFNFYDPSMPDGSENEGSLVFDISTPQLKGLIDPRKLRNVKFVFSVNQLNWPLNSVIPIQASIEMTCQFGKNETDETRHGAKQTNTLSFKMFNYTEKYNFIEVYHVDYVNSEIRVNGENILSALAVLFG